MFECKDLGELRFLVRALDLNLLAEYWNVGDGWGTAGIGVSEHCPENAESMLPRGNKIAGVAKRNQDQIIVTPHTKEFAAFLALLIWGQIDNFVYLLELIPAGHMIFVHKNGENAGIKEELLYICDFLAEQLEKDKREESGKCYSPMPEELKGCAVWKSSEEK